MNKNDKKEPEKYELKVKIIRVWIRNKKQEVEKVEEEEAERIGRGEGKEEIRGR